MKPLVVLDIPGLSLKQVKDHAPKLRAFGEEGFMGGLDPESALTVAKHGADFVALGSAVFGDPARSAQVVSAVNALLDEKAPRFED